MNLQGGEAVAPGFSIATFGEGISVFKDVCVLFCIC